MGIIGKNPLEICLTTMAYMSSIGPSPAQVMSSDWKSWSGERKKMDVWKQ